MFVRNRYQSSSECVPVPSLNSAIKPHLSNNTGKRLAGFNPCFAMIPFGLGVVSVWTSGAALLSEVVVSVVTNCAGSILVKAAFISSGLC